MEKFIVKPLKTHKRIGYARVSTHEQNLDLQLDALKQAQCDLIYEEKVSSASKGRPELEQCLKALRAGDVLVVWRLDRLARSLSDLLSIISSLDRKGVGFESLNEKIDTTTATGKLIFHVFGALSEFERNIISERTKAGLKAARARGRKGGRPPKLTKKQVQEIRHLITNPEITITQIAERYDVSRATVYKVSSPDFEYKTK